jgi:hypothetical protein
MSDLNEALAIADHYWEGEGLPPATEIIETLADAARRWANLTSPETVERVAPIIAMQHGYPWPGLKEPYRDAARRRAEAVLRAVQEPPK